jgi:hypothetical protein
MYATVRAGRSRILTRNESEVRDIQKSLKSQGLPLLTEADESSMGPASFVSLDPDGNPILIDQHVPRPDR